MLAIHPGAYYHIECLEAPRYASRFTRLVRPEDLGSTDLEAFRVLLVPCRTPANRMIAHRERLLGYLDQGGTIVATGESHSHLWLPSFAFHPHPTNYWWWLEEGADLGVTVTASEHELFRYLEPEALTWHLHGWFDPPPGADVLATNATGGAILFDDRSTTNGRMILTTLDSFYHHRSHFMPATTRFLDGFLAWVASLASPDAD